MKDSSELAKRMKVYESVSQTYLMRRTPVIVRLDGVSFHTYTKGMRRPFDDEIMLEAMRLTTLELCKWASGCVFGYTQSDEITLVLTDYKDLTTEPFYDYKVQKLVSIFASRASVWFNKFFMERVEEVFSGIDTAESNSYRSKFMGASFDCRVFNIPKEEVQNNLYWRQLDASRNSVSQLAHYYFSTKELYKKSTSDMQDMLMLEKGVNWNNIPTRLKRGTCCVKVLEQENVVINTDRKMYKWVLDTEAPIFTLNWKYITDRVNFEGDFSKEDE